MTLNSADICGGAASKSTRRTGVRAALGLVLAAAGSRSFAQNSAKGIPKLDLRHHFASPGALKPFISKYGQPGPILAYTPEKSIAAMDQAGIEMAVITCPVPFGDDPALFQDAVMTARALNEFGARMVRDHKGRFRLLAVVPLPQIDASLREIEYAFSSLKADGIGVKASYGNRWLGDAAFAPVLDELNRRGALVHVHPDVAPCCQNLIPGTDPARIEYNTDTSRAIWTMIKDSDSVPSMASRYSNNPLRLDTCRRDAARTGGAIPAWPGILGGSLARHSEAEFQAASLATVLLRHRRVLQPGSDAGAEDARRHTADRVRNGLPVRSHSRRRERT